MRKLNQRLKAVIDDDLCIACGACIPACPYEYLIPAFNRYRGAHEIDFVEAADCTGCEAPCNRVCPSVGIDFAAISLEQRNPPDRDGWMKQVYIGHAPRFQMDGKSSSGGILRALAHYAVESDTPVISLAKTSGDAIDYSPRLMRTEADLEAMPGSIYHSTSFVGVIDILRQLDRPCAMVGIPCQIAGIYNYLAYIEPKLRDKIKYTFGIVCGWMYTYHAHATFITNKHLDIDPVDIGYRGDDKVGLLKFTTAEGTYKFDRRSFESRVDALNYRSAYSTDANRLRCRLCEDHTNLLADVIAGDAWLTRTRGEKTSIVGVRTDRGQQLVDDMSNKGLLKLTDGHFDDFIESQSANLIYGRTAQKKSSWLRGRGKYVPEYGFAGGSGRLKPGVFDRIAFQLERMRRHVLRKGRYQLFWRLYLVKRVSISLASIPRIMHVKLFSSGPK